MHTFINKLLASVSMYDAGYMFTEINIKILEKKSFFTISNFYNFLQFYNFFTFIFSIWKNPDK